MPIPANGEPAPRFRAWTIDGQILGSDDLAGRFTTLCFFGSAGVPQMYEMIQAITANTEIFDGLDHQFVGVSIDPEDSAPERGLGGAAPAVRWIMDGDQSLSRLFGAVAEDGEGKGEGELEAEGEAESATGGDDVAFQPLTVLLDQNLRVLASHKIDAPDKHPIALTQFLGALPTFGPPRLAGLQAPVIFVPMAFEAEFCQRLIAHFEETGGRPSGILEDVDGQTLLTFDPERKRRQDLLLTEKALQQAAHARIARRVAPEIKKAFQFDVTRLERSVIARYQTGDFHARHRDNDALGTAHRRFSITIPLNTEGYTGGHLRIPEFGPQIYQIPTGCAMVHSCGLLHAVTPVQEGTRYAYIPIVYDEAAARLREQNKEHLGEGVSGDRRETQD